ncbi:MAG: peptidoglycan editing factor PgeF [Burkholderiales bacterium]|nr:peptidoglycan editing factor PgeF [Burkholderiales bacterium]
MQAINPIIPEWPAPPGVKALFTTRAGGVSTGPYASLNLGAHVGDEAASVSENRHRLHALLPAVPGWLNQVHGVNVVRAETVPSLNGDQLQADAAVTGETQIPCAVLVADCLPVLFCTEDGSIVGAAHAGWRGLQRGVLERTVEAMNASPARVMAWLGPAIGPNGFEVGSDVLDAFTAVSPDDASAFKPIAGKRDKYFADIYELARRRLRRAGVDAIFGGQFCTFSEPARFFSYRRDRQTGRMAGVIWID